MEVCDLYKNDGPLRVYLFLIHSYFFYLLWGEGDRQVGWGASFKLLNFLNFSVQKHPSPTICDESLSPNGWGFLESPIRPATVSKPTVLSKHCQQD